MAKNRIAYYTQSGQTQTTAVTSSTYVTIFTAGANGTKVLAIYIAADAGSTSFSLAINDGSSDNLIYYDSTGVTINEDILDATKMPKGANGLRYINLESGWTLKAKNNGIQTTTITVYGEDY